MIIEFKGKRMNINLVDTGEGEAVLLLHGWGTNMAVYKTLIDSVSAYRRVISYDIPGFGESEEPGEAFSTDDYADLAYAVLSALGVSRASLIGHSHGGRTILNMLSRDDKAVEIDKAVLIGSAGIVAKKSAKKKLKIRLYKMGKSVLSSAPIRAMFPNALKRFQDSHGSADYRSASPIMRESLVKIVNDDYRDRLAKIKSPTLLIWGDCDTETPFENALLMEKMIADSGIVKVKGGTHYCFLENPNLVFGAIREFLK